MDWWCPGLVPEYASQGESADSQIESVSENISECEFSQACWYQLHQRGSKQAPRMEQHMDAQLCVV